MYMETDVWEVSTGLTATNVPNFSGFHKEEFIPNSKVCLHAMSYPPHWEGEQPGSWVYMGEGAKLLEATPPFL